MLLFLASKLSFPLIHKLDVKNIFVHFKKRKSYSNTNNFSLQDIGNMVNDMISDKIILFISKVKKIRLLI